MEENQGNIQLLNQFANGSYQAFNRFYEKNSYFIYNIAYQIIRDKAEAEDVTQDVFLEVFQKHRQYNPSKGSVKAWLAVKTKSRSIDRLRKKQPLLINRLEGLLEKEIHGAELEFLFHIRKDIILEALNHIPQKQREAIYRFYFQEATHKEIAATMGKPMGSVKSLIRYGLNNLRKQKSIWNWTETGGGEKKNGV